MAQVYQFNTTEMMVFFLVLLRVSAFFVTWPILGAESIPALTKVLFALAVSLILFPHLSWPQQWKTNLFEFDSFQLVWLSLREVFIGVCLGFLSRLFFFVLSVAGDMISMSMGLGNAQLFNPAMNERSSALDQFLSALGVLFFLNINGHYLFIEALRDSFSIVPVAPQGLFFIYFRNVGSLLQEVIVVGLKLSSPVLLSVLFMNFTMAVIGRAVPQINVMVSSLPVNVLLGFLVLFISLPLILWQLPELLESSTVSLFQILRSF